MVHYHNSLEEGCHSVDFSELHQFTPYFVGAFIWPIDSTLVWEHVSNSIQGGCYSPYIPPGVTNHPLPSGMFKSHPIDLGFRLPG